MINAEFFRSEGNLTGFRLSGHSGYAESGRDIVCAAVSSAVQLTANVLDEFGFEPDITVDENVIRCTAEPNEKASRMIGLLKAHLESVLEEFPDTIKITISEV